MATLKIGRVIFCPALFFFCAFLYFPFTAFAEECAAVLSEKTVTHTSFTRARAVLDVVSEVSGRCLTVTADIGQPLPPEGIFATLDATFVHLDLDANNVKIQQAKRQLRFDREQVDRYDQLLASKASAKVRLDALELQRDQTELLLRELQQVENRLQETLRRHRISAPAGWLVTERHIEPGQWVIAGQVLGRLGDFRRLMVPLALTQDEVNGLPAGKVPLFFPELDLQGEATVHRRSPAFDPETRKNRIDLLLTSATMRKLPESRGGIRVAVQLSVPDPMQAVLVPDSAVTERYEEHWLTLHNGESVRVTLLGPASPPPGKTGKWVRISAKDITPGERLQCR